jgi:hypothetical protein
MRFTRSFWLLCCTALLLTAGAHPAHAQATDNIMSESEVEKLREAAYVPADRLAVFIKILDSRSKAIEDLMAKPRHPGREERLHDLMDQFGGIADELNDNLDDYAPKHRDLRKALPKLLEATERWSTTLRSPPDDPAYKVVRKIALDAVRDIHDAAATMQTDQVAYFKAHPEAAKADAERTNPEISRPAAVDIPR